MSDGRQPVTVEKKMDYSTDTPSDHPEGSSESAGGVDMLIHKEKNADVKENLLNRQRPEDGKFINVVFNKLTNDVESKLNKIGSNTPEEKHLIIILFVVIVFSAICHFIQIGFFAYLGSPILVAVNVFSIATYVVCIALLNKKKTAAAGILLSCEIGIVSASMIYLTVVDAFVLSYFLVLLLIQMVIPYAGWKVRIPIIGAILVLICVCSVMVNNHMPFVDIMAIKKAYSVFNILVSASGVIAIIAVDKAVSKMILQINKMKLNKYMDEAHIDALTLLYNRRYAKIVFEEIYSDADQHDEWCVAMLDIDDFKQINDRYGHDFGDVVLYKLAETIKASLRKTDYVFRWGGEEFLILLKNLDIKDSYVILERMRIKIMENEIADKNQSTHLTVTIGLSKYDGGSIEESIKASDKNLYRGKSSGKNAVVM